jgi:hypothetical protein
MARNDSEPRLDGCRQQVNLELFGTLPLEQSPRGSDLQERTDGGSGCEALPRAPGRLISIVTQAVLFYI